MQFLFMNKAPITFVTCLSYGTPILCCTQYRNLTKAKDMNMKGSIKVLATFALLAMVLTVAVAPAAAQLNSNIQPITINANLPEALTVNIAAGGNTITIPLAPNTAANQSTAPAGGTVITTAWVLGPTRTAVKLFV